MAEYSYAKGDVVVIPLPFSDLSSAKNRPAFVVTTDKDDVILCQITSQLHSNAIKITDNDFETGGLNKISFVRPQKLFTADKEIIVSTKGKLNKKTVKNVISKIVEIIQD